MTTQSERLQILKMLEEGQITVDDAAKLLSALEEGTKKEQSSGQPSANSQAKRWFRVRVDDGPNTKVNVNLPVSLVHVGLKIGEKFVPEVDGMEMTELANEIDAAIKDGMKGKIVEVHDEDTHVEIFIE